MSDGCKVKGCSGMVLLDSDGHCMAHTFQNTEGVQRPCKMCGVKQYGVAFHNAVGDVFCSQEHAEQYRYAVPERKEPEPEPETVSLRAMLKASVASHGALERLLEVAKKRVDRFVGERDVEAQRANVWAERARVAEIRLQEVTVERDEAVRVLATARGVMDAQRRAPSFQELKEGSTTCEHEGADDEPARMYYKHNVGMVCKHCRCVYVREKV